MRSFLLLIAFIYSSFLSAQMLKNEDGRVLSEEPFFNEKFIKSVKLKSLSKEFDIKLLKHHRAMDDAKATLELLKLCNE